MPSRKVTVHDDCGEGKHDYHKVKAQPKYIICYRCSQIVLTENYDFIIRTAADPKKTMQRRGLAK